jgi:import receptor subunit TOM70
VHYTQAIALSGDTPTQDTAAAYTNRAVCYQQHARHEDIIEDCTSALAINSQYTKAYIRRAMAYEALEKFKKAKEDYGKAKELEPASRPASDGLSRVSKILATM